MKPVYTDIHIHTSENADNLTQKYDVDTLFAKVRQMAQGASALLSFTDHNTINEKAYLSALAKCGDDIHLLLGVELHIHYDLSTEAYHCHMLFKGEVTREKIQAINTVLDELYPNKVVAKKSASIPTLDKVINSFDTYDFVLLPHGGQSHATFDKAIPAGARFDTMMERSIYYNQFDGFTARNEKGRDATDEYFKKLGISEFINLLTCSDNYDPRVYPQSKDANAEPLNPTWMFAEPTFDGLRLSLSEKSRLVYSEQKPGAWSLNIGRVVCKNDQLDIDVQFTSGLNVIIGGSSSGKTLLVDSLSRKLKNEGFQGSNYEKFGVSSIEVDNPSAMQPHYIYQNFIMKVVGGDEEHGIQDVDLIKSIFPSNSEVLERITSCLGQFKAELSRLINCVQKIEEVEKRLKATPQVGSILVLHDVKKNIFDGLVPEAAKRRNIIYSKEVYAGHKQKLKEIQGLIDANPFVESLDEEFAKIFETLSKIRHYSKIEGSIYEVIKSEHSAYDTALRAENSADQQKTQLFLQLITDIKEYVKLQSSFKKSLSELVGFTMTIDTRDVESAGHHLYISNNFVMSKEKLLEVFNYFLKNPIASFDLLEASALFEGNYRKRNPKVDDYDDFINKVSAKFNESNKTKYKIITREEKDFDSLSAGWKTSVLLDLILGYEQDIAPIIIDQPEDNLATKYINDGLVEAIKKVKTRRQIIMVSHNATIPMMGDAQNIIYCVNKGDKIVIRSSSLEGQIGDVPALDLIATITDGGKPSIKKRVKKYNLKKFTDR